KSGGGLITRWGAEQVLHLEAKPRLKFGGEPLAMAVRGVALVAQEAQRPSRFRLRILGEGSEFVERFPRRRRRKVALVDPQHLCGMPGTRRNASFLRSAERAQMHV